MILLGMSGISWLFFQKQRGMAQLQESEERSGLALQGGILGSWTGIFPAMRLALVFVGRRCWVISRMICHTP